MSVFLTPDGPAVLRRDLLPARAAPRPAGVPRTSSPAPPGPGATQRLEVVAAGQRSRRDARPSRTACRPTAAAPTDGLLDAARSTRSSRASTRCNGGWGGAPKFPQPMTLDFLLGRIAARRSGGAVAMVRYTLDRMADGGIHDQLGGGFHRYATDPIWLVPHFEQMLYDNAQLARTYLRAWAMLRRSTRYRRWREAVLEYLLRELAPRRRDVRREPGRGHRGRRGRDVHLDRRRDPRGARRRRRRSSARPTASRDEGNWEGRTILSRLEPAAGDDGATTRRARPRLAAARARLLERRATRPQPARDDKALAAWNGLAIGALADAARLLARGRRGARYRDGGDRPRPTRSSPGCRRRTAGSGGRGRTVGRPARASSRTTPTSPTACSRCTRRRSTSAGSSRRASSRTRSSTNSPIRPAASSTPPTTTRRSSRGRRTRRTTRSRRAAAMATRVLLRLAALTGEGRYRAAAERALATVAPFLGRYPTGFAQWLVGGRASRSRGVVELAIVGAPGRRRRRGRCSRRSGRRPRPDQVVAVAADRIASARAAARRPRRDRRPADGLRVPRLRLPPAGHGARRARRPAQVGAGGDDPIEVPSCWPPSGSWFARRGVGPSRSGSRP